MSKTVKAVPADDDADPWIPGRRPFQTPESAPDRFFGSDSGSSQCRHQYQREGKRLPSSLDHLDLHRFVLSSLAPTNQGVAQEPTQATYARIDARADSFGPISSLNEAAAIATDVKMIVLLCPSPTGSISQSRSAGDPQASSGSVSPGDNARHPPMAPPFRGL